MMRTMMKEEQWKAMENLGPDHQFPSETVRDSFIEKKID